MAEGLISVTAGSGIDISAQTMEIGGNTVYQERAIPGIGVITLPGTAQVVEEDGTGLTPTNAIDIQGRFYIICKCTFNATNSNCTLRIAFYDSNNALIGYSESIYINNLGISDGGSRYFGDTVIYTNDFGAESIKFYVESISGNITIFVGAT